MNITINGKPADITLDTEKTLGDVLAGIEQWVSSLGSRIREISVNGQVVQDDALSLAFGKELTGIKKLDIALYSYRELAGEALSMLSDTCALYGSAAFDERPQISGGWEKSAAAQFLRTDIPDMYELAGRTFAGEGLSAQGLGAVIEERLWEITSPAQEIAGCETAVKTTAERMQELPLDIQTGKDQRAAETIQRFSGTAEKLFRLFFILKSEGLSLDAFTIDALPVRAFMDEFNTALTELSAAYENKDTVLVGDLSEYELAPRLVKFFSALKKHSQAPQEFVSTP